MIKYITLLETVLRHKNHLKSLASWEGKHLILILLIGFQLIRNYGSGRILGVISEVDKRKYVRLIIKARHQWNRNEVS